MEKTFSDDLIKLIVSLIDNDLFALRKKLVCGLFLHKDKENQISFLKDEAKKTIDYLLANSRTDMLYGMFSDAKPNEAEIKTYPDKFITHFQEDVYFPFDDIEKYDEVLKPLKNKKLSEKICFQNLKLYNEINNQKEQIMQLSRMEDFLTTLTYLYHLALVYDYIKSVSNDESPTDSLPNQSQTRKIIKNHFEAMDEMGWKYAFREKNDFEAYCNLLTQFFEFKSPEPPNYLIKLKPNSKSKIAWSLKKIHYDLGEDLKNDIKFFIMVRVLSLFSKKSDKEIRDIMRRQTNK